MEKLLIDIVLDQWERQDAAGVERWSYFLVGENKIPYYKTGAKYGYGHNSAVNDEASAREMFAKFTDKNYFIGVAAGAVSGGIFALDIDVNHKNTPEQLKNISVIKSVIENNFGDLPKTEIQITKSLGEHYLYYDVSIGNKTNICDFEKNGIWIDIKGAGSFFVLYNYEINFENISNAPPWIKEKIKFRNSYDGTDNSNYTGVISLCEEMKRDIPNALLFLDYSNRDLLVTCGMALKTLNSDDAKFLWVQWASNFSDFSEKYVLSKWDSFHPKDIGIQKLFNDAKKEGFIANDAAIEISIKKQEVLKTTNKPRFEVKGAREVFIPRPPIKWLVDRLICESSLSILVADAGCGKTWAAVDLTACIALGVPWMNRDVTQGNVLFIDEESGDDYFAPRFKKAILSHNGTEPSVEGKVFFISMENISLMNLLDLYEIEKLIIEKDIKFITIDAAMDVLPGVKENNSDEVSIPLNALKKIAHRTKSSFFVIHHKTKPGKDNDKTGYRGSGAFKGTADLLLDIHRQKNSQILQFETEKIRNGAPVNFNAELIITDFDFKLELTDKKEENKLKREFNDLDLKLLEYISNNPESKNIIIINEIGKHLYKKDTINSHLKQLNIKDLIVKEKIGTSTKEGVKWSIHPEKHFFIKKILEKGYSAKIEGDDEEDS